MLVSLLSAFVLAQAATDLGAPPQSVRRETRPACTCPDDAPAPDLVFRGIVIDAQILIDSSGRNAESRQATIFRVIRKLKGEVESPAKIWHSTNLKKCGVVFDYGRIYTVRARLVEETMETDLCLAPAPVDTTPEDGATP